MDCHPEVQLKESLWPSLSPRGHSDIFWFQITSYVPISSWHLWVFYSFYYFLIKIYYAILGLFCAFCLPSPFSTTIISLHRPHTVAPERAALDPNTFCSYTWFSWTFMDSDIAHNSPFLSFHLRIPTFLSTIQPFIETWELFQHNILYILYVKIHNGCYYYNLKSIYIYFFK